MKQKITPKEIYDYCKYRDIMPKFVNTFYSTIIVRDPKYENLSEPGFAIVYNFENNNIEYTRIDNTWHQIVDDTTRKIKAGYAGDSRYVKDTKTFFDFISSLNQYCREYNCDYNKALSFCWCAESPYNSNQTIHYYKTDKSIRFLEVHDRSEPYNRSKPAIVDKTIKLEEICGNLVNTWNLRDFAEESFRFCKETGCSFADYANEIAYNQLKLKYARTDNPQKELLCLTMNKDILYWSDNTISIRRIVNNEAVYVTIENKFSELTDSVSEFHDFMKTYKVFINGLINERLRKDKQQKELEKLTGAAGEFASRGQEK